jgi:hypothetical protein
VVELGAGSFDAVEVLVLVIRWGGVDQGVESGDEALVSFGFGDPASLFGVAGEVFGVDALGGEDG